MPDMSSKPRTSWLDLNLDRFLRFNLENTLAVLIMILTVVTRLYGLGERTFTHDELNTVTAAYNLSTTGDLNWFPMEHGPLEMHLVAASFQIFGDNDFTARLPAALFGIAAVAIVLFLFRRYLGRTGALLAGFFYLISPFMLYYARYQRNEALIVVWSLLSIYAILRYLERGETGMLILYSAVYALHSTDKITSMMYAGGQFAFLVAYFLIRILRRGNLARVSILRFAASLVVSAVFLVAAAFMLRGADSLTMIPGAVVGLIGLAAGVIGVVSLVREIGFATIRAERSFDLIILIGTLTLPLISAVPIRIFGFDPQNIAGSNLRTSFFFFLPLAALAITVGVWWKPRIWPILAAVFFGIYAFIFTTAFTKWIGLADGLFNFLGYWISVQLGQGHLVYQPWFYYLVIQIPVYEYLSATGMIIAFAICIRRGLWSTAPWNPYEKPGQPPSAEPHSLPVMALILYWSIFNIAVFTYGLEKMPQQTTLMACPMLLALAWAVGYLIEKKPGEIVQRFFRWTYTVSAGFTGSLRTAGLVAILLLALLTAHTAYQASFLNYDNPYEYMTYASSSPDSKYIVREIERLSLLTTGGNNLRVSYSYWAGYPLWWYLRGYPNAFNFGSDPSADIRESPVIVVDDDANSKVDKLIGEDYVSFRLVRMWWHNQEFWKLQWNDIRSAYLNDEYEKGVTSPPPMSIGEYLRRVFADAANIILKPDLRAAAFQVWLNRDWKLWGQVTGNSGLLRKETWPGNAGITLYLRKDILDYLGGATPETGSAAGYDPYTLSRIELFPGAFIGQSGGESGQFQAPRAIAMAPDGSFYVADSCNNRIQHFDPAGNWLSEWGAYASIDDSAPGGTFNEPWGVAVGPDGSVYVADTWNHRVQKFTADGQFLTMWGTGPSDPTAPVAFYGPRAVAIDSKGRVFVADTGFKRVMVFSPEGEPLGQFGTRGAGAGELDEPVGLAIDDQDRIYVADTWNRRVQIFEEQTPGQWTSVAAWNVNGWFGVSVDNKPYLTVDADHHVFLTDPSTCRIMEFTEGGVILAVWGQCGDDASSLSGPTGLALDSQGGLWVSDSLHDRLVYYLVPNPAIHRLEIP